MHTVDLTFTGDSFMPTLINIYKIFNFMPPFRGIFNGPVCTSCVLGFYFSVQNTTAKNSYIDTGRNDNRQIKNEEICRTLPI